MSYAWKVGERDQIIEDAVVDLVSVAVVDARVVAVDYAGAVQTLTRVLDKRGLITADRCTRLTPRQQRNLLSDTLILARALIASPGIRDMPSVAAVRDEWQRWLNPPTVSIEEEDE